MNTGSIQEVLFSMPWQCGDGDCEYQWHKSTYWMDTTASTGYTVDNYSDGDHDEVQEEEVPKTEDVYSAWYSYDKYVASEGVDPLGDYNVEFTTSRQQTWQVAFRNSILGCVCIGGRRNSRGGWHKAEDLPWELQSYLALERFSESGRGSLVYPEGLENLKDAVLNEGLAIQRHKTQFRFTVKIDVYSSRSDLAIARDLKALARRRLASAHIKPNS